MRTVTPVLLVVSLLLGTLAASAHAEEPKPSEEKFAELADEFSAPLTTLPQIFIQDAYTPKIYGTDAQANRLIARLIVPRTPRHSLLPLQLFDLAVIPWPERESGLLMGVGPVFVFPIATDKAAGQNAWQAGPAFGAIYEGIPELLMGCLIQNPISFAYTSIDRQVVNNLFFQPILLHDLGHGFYVKSADSTWTMGWRSGSATTLPLSLVSATCCFTRIGRPLTSS